MSALARLSLSNLALPSGDPTPAAQELTAADRADAVVRAARAGRDPHAFAVLLLGAPEGTVARVRVVMPSESAQGVPVEREVVIPTTPSTASYGMPASRMFNMPERGVSLALDLPSRLRVEVPWSAITPGADGSALDDAGVVELARLPGLGGALAAPSQSTFLARHGRTLAIGGAVALAVAAVAALSSSGDDGVRANPSCGADCTCAPCRKRHGARRKGR
jgi:hypothetical protein